MSKVTSLLFLLFSAWVFSQKESTAQANVKIISENFAVPQLKTNRRIWICLPKDYTTTAKRYPVLYLQDGQNLFDDETSYAGEWQIDESLNKIYDDTGKSAIIIGIDNGGDKRMDELSPFKNDKYGGGKGDDYINFIIQTLKPFVDKNYRTKASKKYTMIGGSSLGALISVYGAVKHPEVFSKVLAFSPAFWFNSKAMETMFRYSRSDLRTQRYYFIQGKHEDEGMDKETLKIIQNLKEKKVRPKNIFFREDEDGKHNEMYWRREFPDAFLWLLK